MTRPLNRVILHIVLPPEVAEELDVRLVDPVTFRPRYGARSQLVTNLLRQWLQQQREKDQQPS